MKQQKQSWEKEFDKFFSVAYPPSGQEFEYIPLPDQIKKFIKEQLTKAKREGASKFATWLSVQKGYKDKTVLYELQYYLKTLK